MAGSKIPTAADLPQVAPQSLPGYRVGDISGGMPEAMTELGNAAGEYGLVLRDRAEETEAQDLPNQLRDAQRLLMDGDGSKENPGYVNLTGKTAVDERNNYEAGYRTKYDTLLGTASNDRVRAKIATQFSAQRDTFLTNVSRHQGGQRIKHEDQVHTTASDNLTELAIGEATFDEAKKTWSNKRTIAEQHAANLRHYTTRTGDVKVAREMADEVRSKTHIEVIDDLLTREGGGVLAEKYFNAHTSEISNKIKNEVRNRVKVGSRADVVQKFSDDVFAKAEGGPKGKTLSQLSRDVEWQRTVHAQIGKKFSGETETAARAEFDGRLARLRLGEVVERRAAEHSAMAWVLEKKPYKDWAKANPEMAHYVSGNGPLMDLLTRKIPARVQTAEEFATTNDKPVKETHEKMTGDELRQIPDATFNSLKKSLTKQTWDKLNTTRNTAKRKFDSQKNPNTRDIDGDVEKIMKQVAAQLPSKFDFSTAKRLHVKKHLRVNAAVLRERMKEWLDRTIEASKGSDGKGAAKFPDDKEIRREVMRLTASIVADPVNTGQMWAPKEGEEEIKGMIMRLGPFSDGKGNLIYKMSPAQLAVARVPFKSIPDVMLERIKNNIRKSPDTITQNRVSDEGFIEQVAGAFVTKNQARLRVLLKAFD
jgi:hypothetical protein